MSVHSRQLQAVQIYAFDETLVKTTRFQLLQWKHAMRLELQGMTMSGGRKVSTHLRKLLKTPKRYPIEHLLDHISKSIEDIDEQFANGDFNYVAEAPGYQQSDNWPD